MQIGVPDRRIENNTPNEFRQPFRAEKRPDVFGHSGVSVLLVFLFRILSIDLEASARRVLECPNQRLTHQGPELLSGLQLNWGLILKQPKACR
jgi:hypothetical protein